VAESSMNSLTLLFWASAAVRISVSCLAEVRMLSLESRVARAGRRICSNLRRL